MKKNLFNIITIIICIFLLSQLIIKKTLITNSIIYSLNIWVNNLIPTLFPFFIISDILINYKFTNYIPNFFKKLCKSSLNITDNMLTILLLSIISGFPSNARNTKTLYDNKEITIDEANHILIFSHFSNPLFILTTISLFLHTENNKSISIIILLSHYLSNLILAILFKNYFHHQQKNLLTNNNNKTNFGTTFINSIKKSIDTILLICGIITSFYLISSIINNTFNLNEYNSTLIKGILEITIGIESLGKLNIPLIYKTVITSCFLAFGGLSVHIQVLSQIIDTDIKYKYFLIGRIYQTIISGLITILIYKIYL